MTFAERNRAIKKALSKVYGSGVRLIGGKGTATGWIHLYITLPKPDHDHTISVNEWGNCRKCNDISREVENQAEFLALQVARNAGSKVYTYTADDGYNTEYNEIITQVQYI